MLLWVFPTRNSDIGRAVVDQWKGAWPDLSERGPIKSTNPRKTEEERKGKHDAAMKRTGGNVPHSSNLHSRSERKKWTFAKPTNGRRDRAIKKRTINLQVITIVGRTFRGDDGEREDTLQRTERSPSEENKQPINNIHDASFFLFHCWRDRPRPFRRWAPLCAETERGFERTSLGFLLPSFPPSILSHLLALGKKGLHEKEKNATTKPV